MFVSEPNDISRIPTKIDAKAMKKSNDTHENCKGIDSVCGAGGLVFPRQLVHDHSGLLKQLPHTARPQL
jgi:hypothetical protein